MKTSSQLVLIASLCALAWGCGDGGSFTFTTESGITEVTASSSGSSSGSAAVTATVKVGLLLGGVPDGFGDNSFESTPFDLVVLVPRGASYQDKSSKVADSIFGDEVFGDPDRRDPNEQGSCSDGRSYLLYNFRRGEFGDPEALDSSDAFLKLKLAVTPTAQGARAEAALRNPPEVVVDPCRESGDLSGPLTVSQ